MLVDMLSVKLPKLKVVTVIGELLVVVVKKAEVVVVRVVVLVLV